MRLEIAEERTSFAVSHMSSQGKLDCHGRSDVGRVRPSNEDQFLIADLSKSLLVHETSMAVDDHSRLFGSTHRASGRTTALAVDVERRVS